MSWFISAILMDNITTEIAETIESVEMWKDIEQNVKVGVPKYIQNLMESQGFDNIVSIKRMTQEDIDFLESFGKSEKYEKKIPKDANRAHYYGSAANKEDFEIVRGHRKLIEEIIEYAKKANFLSAKKGLFISCD